MEGVSLLCSSPTTFLVFVRRPSLGNDGKEDRLQPMGLYREVEIVGELSRLIWKHTLCLTSETALVNVSFDGVELFNPDVLSSTSPSSSSYCTLVDAVPEEREVLDSIVM